MLLVNQSLDHVACQADGCDNLKFFNNVSGNPTDTGLCSTKNDDDLGNITCNATVTMGDDGTILICGVLRKNGNVYSKDELKVLVQG